MMENTIMINQLVRRRRDNEKDTDNIQTQPRKYEGTA